LNWKLEIETKIEKKYVKPFLKWAGGKRQHLNDIKENLPPKIKESGVIENYIEPFLGGGSVFFFLWREFKIKKTLLIDINKKLILTYQVIKENPDELIKQLKEIKNKFYSFTDLDKKEKFYYRIRDRFNENQKLHFSDKHNNRINIAADFIFLNKTCFNGLYRENKNGEFNVPFGKQKKPLIMDKENIKNVSLALQECEIKSGDYSISDKNINKASFVYFDPPYKPINKTSSFTSYTRNGFNETEQERLANFFREMDKKGALLMLSNSSGSSDRENGDYFKKLYTGFDIIPIDSLRSINSKGHKRTGFYDLLIVNY